MNLDLLIYALEEISRGEELGEIDICGESVCGNDAWATFNILDVCEEAAKKLTEFQGEDDEQV